MAELSSPLAGGSRSAEAGGSPSSSTRRDLGSGIEQGLHGELWVSATSPFLLFGLLLGHNDGALRDGPWSGYEP